MDKEKHITLLIIINAHIKLHISSNMFARKSIGVNNKVQNGVKFPFSINQTSV